jgi:hypothetical protein
MLRIYSASGRPRITDPRRWRSPRHSTGDLWPIGRLRRAPVDAFEQVPELCWRDRHGCIGGAGPRRRRRPDEAALLQPLREKARTLAIVPDHFDQIAAPAAEHEQVTRMRIGFQRFLHEQRQARKTAPHVGVARRKPHAQASVQLRIGRNRDHHAVSSAAIKRFAARYPHPRRHEACDLSQARSRSRPPCGRTRITAPSSTVQAQGPNRQKGRRWLRLCGAAH